MSEKPIEGDWIAVALFLAALVMFLFSLTGPFFISSPLVYVLCTVGFAAVVMALAERMRA